MIKVEHVTKTYRKDKKELCRALDDVSFTLPETGFVFIVGKSGSGKSTLLNMLGGLDKATEGSIQIGKNNLSKFSETQMNKYHATFATFIFQDYHLFDNLTVEENVFLGHDLSVKKKKFNIDELLEQVGLQGYAKKYPTELSGGERQRVAIARALAKDARLILADEPTGNLDANTSKQILDLLQKISKQKLVIIVSHNLVDADIYADRLIELHEGRILSDQSKREGYTRDFAFKEEDGSVVFPHHRDLTEEEVSLLEEKFQKYKVKRVEQQDNGFVDTEEISLINPEKIRMKNSKASKKLTHKLTKMFFLKGMNMRIITTVIVVLLFAILTILQSFLSFDISTNTLTKEDPAFVLTKGSDIPFKDSINTATLYDVTAEDIQAFRDTGYTGKIHKCYPVAFNVSHSAYAGNNPSSIKCTNTTMRSIAEFYLVSTYGVVECDEAFLASIYGKDGQVTYRAKTDTPHADGIVITDYIADSIQYHHPEDFPDDEHVLSDLSFANFGLYIDGIIQTGYAERYQKFRDHALEGKAIDFPLYDLDKELYHRFGDEVIKYLGVGYFLGEDFLQTTNQEDTFGYLHFTLAYQDPVSGNRYAPLADTKSPNIEVKNGLADDEIYLTEKLYNQLFDEFVTKKTFDPNAHPIVTLSYETLAPEGEEKQLFKKDFTIKGLATHVLVSRNMLETFAEFRLMPTALYFENTDQANQLIELGKSLHFYTQNLDIYGALIVNKLAQGFYALFLIFTVLLYVLIFIYNVTYGINRFRSNSYEIGVYKAMGGRMKTLVSIFTFDMIVAGVTTCLCSLFATPLLVGVANAALESSFTHILSINFFALDIVKLIPGYLAFNLVALLLIISVTPILSTLLFRRKPIIEMIKSTYKEG